MRREIIELVLQLAGTTDAFEKLEQFCQQHLTTSLNESLLDCGVIPEALAHDSSEEKLWAKYCDILLAQSLTALGISAEVLRTRGDSADVWGKTDNYTLVGDAKAFRLSRTAKNQKDFKIKALDDWRRSDTFACLVAPLYQFPSRRSQIYQQAIEHNVALLSYVHLGFMLDHFAGQALTSLWTVGTNLTATQAAQDYWAAIDTAVCNLMNVDISVLATYKQNEVQRVKVIGTEGIRYWREIMSSYHNLSQAEAVARLIKAEKIDSKIENIQKTLNAMEM